MHMIIEIGLGMLAMWLLSGDSEKDKKDPYNQGVQHEQAKHILKWGKIIKRVEKIKTTLEDDRQYFDLIIALYAVSISAAYSDGLFTKEEENSIREFIGGTSHVALPKRVKTVFERIYKNPPALNTAMRYVKKVPQEYWPLFTDVVDFVVNEDGNVTERERAFQQAWHKKMAA